MSSTYISADLRRLVVSQANHLCEYCLIHEEDTHFGCQADHVISEKHGGETSADNLALACCFCNRYKGSDIGSIEWESGEFVRFYHPRTDLWWRHFSLDGIEIVPLTSIGKVTARILRFNDVDRLVERKALQEMGRYPPSEAMTLLQG